MHSEQSHSQSLEQLSKEEESKLAQCEEIIDKHLKAFIEVGRALMQIRDHRLYRAEFETFDEYCRNRWDISRVHAHRLLKATEVVEAVLLPMGNTLMPECERQIRPLVGMQKEEAQRVWKAATESSNGRKVTGNHVLEAKKSINARLDHVSASPGRETWQDLVEPLLEEALSRTKEGDRDAVEDILFKVQLNLQIGRDRSAAGI